MSDQSSDQSESERLAREQGSKEHSEAKHRRQAGQGHPKRDPSEDASDLPERV